MLAAEESTLPLEAVADNTDAAVRAGRRQRMDRAFEAVIGVSLAAQNHLKRLVVIVPAGFADCHDTTQGAVHTKARIQTHSAAVSNSLSPSSPKIRFISEASMKSWRFAAKLKASVPPA